MILWLPAFSDKGLECASGQIWALVWSGILKCLEFTCSFTKENFNKKKTRGSPGYHCEKNWWLLNENKDI